MPITNQKKALIHVAKSQLGMADQEYRAMLTRVAAVRSSSALDEIGFERVMAEFERQGFRNPRSRNLGDRRVGMATPSQIGRIRGLWKAYSGNDDEIALGHWMEKHFTTSNLRFLEASRAGKVIAVLEKMKAWRQQHTHEEQQAANAPEGSR